MKKPYIIVMTTCPNPLEASKLMEAIIERNLAACVQAESITSTYRWQNKIETAQEVRLTIKTKAALFDAIERVIKQHSSYDNPEIISLPILQGSKAYFDWIDQTTKSAQANDEINVTKC